MNKFEQNELVQLCLRAINTVREETLASFGVEPYSRELKELREGAQRAQILLWQFIYSLQLEEPDSASHVLLKDATSVIRIHPDSPYTD